VLPLATIKPAHAEDLGHALVREGLPCIEIALRTPDAVDAIARASKIDGLLVGAGTVHTPAQARAAAGAGAGFALAPELSEDVVACCRELGLPFFPGVATPTELGHAVRLGCTTVKVFPAGTVGGPAFLRAVSATFPHVRFIPTGGIDGGSLASYLAVPSVVACGGSWICEPGLIRERRFDEIAQRARAAAEAA